MDEVQLRPGPSPLDLLAKVLVGVILALSGVGIGLHLAVRSSSFASWLDVALAFSRVASPAVLVCIAALLVTKTVRDRRDRKP